MLKRIFNGIAGIGILIAAGGAWSADAPSLGQGNTSKTPATPIGSISAATHPETGSSRGVVPIIGSVEINPAKARPNQVVIVKVLGTGNCKFKADLGDGRTLEQEGTLPVTFPISYAVAGSQRVVFTVKVSGENGCQGSAQSSVSVGLVQLLQ